MIGALSAAAAVLLAVAGLAKLHDPQPAAAMLRTVAPVLRRRRMLFRALPGAVRTAGAGELSLGVAVLTLGDRWTAGLLGVVYLAFVAITLVLLRRGGSTSCGCFGSTASPVGAPHLVVNVAAVALAFVSVVRPSGPLGGYTDTSLTTATTGLAQVALLAALAYLAITALPALTSARRHLEETA